MKQVAQENAVQVLHGVFLNFLALEDDVPNINAESWMFSSEATVNTGVTTPPLFGLQRWKLGARKSANLVVANSESANTSDICE